MLMSLDLTIATELSKREKDEWERRLKCSGLGGYIVPYFYFLAKRDRPRRRPPRAVSILLLLWLAPLISACDVVRSNNALNKAGEYYEKKQYQEALQLYKEAVRLTPDGGAAHCGLANTLRALGRPDEAIASYQTANELEPDYVRCRYPLAVLLYERGEYDRSKAECAIVLRQMPTVCECKVYWALIAQKQGQQIEARRLFKEVEDAAPGCIGRVPGADATYLRLQ
jgi:tetratricopeptide (TPR) repeat protein